MGLFSKTKLKTTTKGKTTRISWKSLTTIDMILFFTYLLSIIFLIYQENKTANVYDTLTGLKYFYVLLFFYFVGIFHLIFNRKNTLDLSTDLLSYKRRLIFGISKKIKPSSIVSVTLDIFTDPIAESSMPDRSDIQSIRIIVKTKDKHFKIKGIGESDAKIIKAKIEALY